jgi:IS30 family transposase
MAKKLSIAQVAATTGRGLSTVYSDVKRGRLSATTSLDGKLYVTATALKSYSKNLVPVGSFSR